ncbi:unnamed protein product, partial [Phaeothamnion confervicola]
MADDVDALRGRLIALALGNTTGTDFRPPDGWREAAKVAFREAEKFPVPEGQMELRAWIEKEMLPRDAELSWADRFLKLLSRLERRRQELPAAGSVSIALLSTNGGSDAGANAGSGGSGDNDGGSGSDGSDGGNGSGGGGRGDCGKNRNGLGVGGGGNGGGGDSSEGSDGGDSGTSSPEDGDNGGTSITSSRRVLLVLDLNHFLCERVYMGRAPPDITAETADACLGKNYIFVRPGLHDFLDWALSRFDLAVWTSGRRENTSELLTLLLGVERRKRLAFFWTQDACVYAGNSGGGGEAGGRDGAAALSGRSCKGGTAGPGSSSGSGGTTGIGSSSGIGANGGAAGSGDVGDSDGSTGAGGGGSSGGSSGDGGSRTSNAYGGSGSGGGSSSGSGGGGGGGICVGGQVGGRFDTKPLFLKRLQDVWDIFPEYDARNTLLVDDSAEKCAENPPFTAVHPPPWTYRRAAAAAAAAETFKAA